MFYGRRKRIATEQAEVAAGSNLWTDVLVKPARIKLMYAVQNFFRDTGGMYSVNLIQIARRETLEELGLASMSGDVSDWEKDFFDGILNAPEDVVLTALEAILLIGHVASNDEIADVPHQDRQAFLSRLPSLKQTISTVFREHWFKCDLVNGRFVDFESRVLHEGIVVPALTLLGGNTKFANAEKAFQEALREIHNGSPEDAITDATTALQEVFVALGVRGNTVSKCIEAAISAGLLESYDRKLGEWLEADRSNKGDAHNARSAAVEDAWLVVHVVGAIIVRLSGVTPRGPAQ